MAGSLRRMLGLFVFFYILMHFLTWLILDQGLYWSGILSDVAKRPFITIGFLGVAAAHSARGHINQRHDASTRPALENAAPARLC